MNVESTPPAHKTSVTAAAAPALVPEHRVVALAGDWHGNGPWARTRLGEAAEAGISVVLHLGDFGVWPGPSGKRYLLAVEKTAAELGITVLVTPGNHEDWARLTLRTPKDRGDGWGPAVWLTEHIGVLPRAARFRINSGSGPVRSFVSLGGAPSVDFDHRRQGVDWWPQEAITQDDVDATIEGGFADVMLAHDAPDGGTDAVSRIVSSNPFGFSLEALEYARQGRELMTQAFRGVAPRMFAHGHYHVHDVADVRVGDDGDWCRMVSLNCDGEAGNMVALDLSDLSLHGLREVPARLTAAPDVAPAS